MWSVFRPGEDTPIEAASRPPGGRWGRPRILANGVGEPAAAMTPTGEAVVVWLQRCVTVASPSQCAPSGPTGTVVRAVVRSARGV